ELTLEEHVVGLVQAPGERAVHVLEAVPVPAAIRDAVLVPDDARAPAPREPDQRARVSGKRAAPEIEHVEPARLVRKLVLERLELDGAAVRRLAADRDPVPPVEDARGAFRRPRRAGDRGPAPGIAGGSRHVTCRDAGLP